MRVRNYNTNRCIRLLQLVREPVADRYAPMVQHVVGRFDGAVLHPALRHPLRGCVVREYSRETRLWLWLGPSPVLIPWVRPLSLSFSSPSRSVGRVPSDAPVDHRVDHGDEVLDTGRAAGRGAEVRRPEDYRW